MTITLALSADWDLTVDANGNVATVSGGSQLAQDAASACRLFLGELWFDTTQGVPYWQQLLGTGTQPPNSLITAKLEDAALTVPGVETASVTITNITARTVVGTVTVSGTDAAGNSVTGTASF